MSTLTTLKQDYGIDNKVEESQLSAEDKAVVEELKELLSTERKAFISRKASLQSNFPKLFSLEWVQCTPLLQQDIRNLTEYKKAYKDRDCLWLLNQLNKSF